MKCLSIVKFIFFFIGKTQKLCNCIYWTKNIYILLYFPMKPFFFHKEENLRIKSSILEPVFRGNGRMYFLCYALSHPKLEHRCIRKKPCDKLMTVF